MEHSLFCLKPDEKRKKEKEKNSQKNLNFPPLSHSFYPGKIPYAAATIFII